MLIGNKVILEEISPEDIEQMRVWRNDISLRRFFREYKDITKDQQQKWYNSRGNNSDPSHVYFKVTEYSSTIEKENVDHSTKRLLVGCCGLHYIDWRNRSAEFGVFLGTSRGGGKGKEALELLFDYGFKELNLHRIWAEVYDFNNALNLYTKIGFRQEGLKRDAQFCEGRYTNSHMISMLDNEWTEKYGNKPLWYIGEP